MNATHMTVIETPAADTPDDVFAGDPYVDYDWKPAPRVEGPRIKFAPRYSVVPETVTAARELAKEWAAQFNDDEEAA